MQCANGDDHYYINGKRHREDGPAIVRKSGHTHWFFNDQEMTADEVFSRLSREKQKEIIFNNLHEWGK